VSRRPAFDRILALFCLTMVPAAGAQNLISTSGASLSVAAPGETDYAAGVSGPTQSYTVVTACTGTGFYGCRLFLQYGSNPQGQQLDMEYAIVSLGKGSCENAAANPAVWFPVLPTSVLLTTRKNAKCVATFQFRVSPLTWAAHQSPGPPGGAYRQQLRFQFTRP